MGFFGRGKKRPPLEERLLEEYSHLLALMHDVSPEEGRRLAEEMLEAAKHEAEREGTDGWSGMADTYLASAASSPRLSGVLAATRDDGATDADIRWWWDMPDLERRMMVLVNNNSRLAFLLKGKQDGMTMEQAVAELRRTMPTFGDPTDTKHTSGDDRPLPWELLDRVNTWVVQWAPNLEALQQQLASASSYNALLRRAIRAGQL